MFLGISGSVIKDIEHFVLFGREIVSVCSQLAFDLNSLSLEGWVSSVRQRGRVRELFRVLVG